MLILRNLPYILDLGLLFENRVIFQLVVFLLLILFMASFPYTFSSNLDAVGCVRLSLRPFTLYFAYKDFLFLTVKRYFLFMLHGFCFTFRSPGFVR